MLNINLLVIILLVNLDRHHLVWNRLKTEINQWGRLRLRNRIFEPPHDKTNKMACSPSEDSTQSDQSLHCPHEEALVLSYPMSAQLRLIRLGRCPGWSESSLGTQSFCWFCHEAAQISCPVEMTVETIWAWSWEKLFMPYAKKNIDVHQPAYLHSLISTFVFHCLGLCNAMSKISIL